MWYLIKWIAFLASWSFLEIAHLILWYLNMIFFFKPLPDFQFKGKIKTGDIVPLMPYIDPTMVQYHSHNELHVQSVRQPDWLTVHYSQKFYKNYYDYFWNKEPKEIKKWTALTYVGKN